MTMTSWELFVQIMSSFQTCLHALKEHQSHKITALFWITLVRPNSDIVCILKALGA